MNIINTEEIYARIAKILNITVEDVKKRDEAHDPIIVKMFLENAFDPLIVEY